MDGEAAESADSIEPHLKLAAALILAGALGVSTYAALALRGLFADGARGRVASAIASDDRAGWHPFDNTDPGDLPDGPQFDSRAYQAALLRQQSAATDK